MYLPRLTDAVRVRAYLIGPLLTILYTDCESDGSITYKHVLFAYAPPQAEGQPPQTIFAVAAERSDAMAALDVREDAHFLGVFDGRGHGNMGLSTEWADLETFCARALELVASHFKIEEEPVELPNPDGGHSEQN